MSDDLGSIGLPAEPPPAWEQDGPIDGYPGWEWRGCECCNGIAWGGETPEECRDCGGSGRYALHVASGALAAYPGGPFIGRCWQGAEGAADD